jgi:prevent-host-death family protein
MTSVGIRELRQRASELLRLVEAGETVQITDRGRPVAVLAPLPSGPLARMRAAGEIEAAADDSAFDPPLELDGAELPSTVLARMRADER